MPRLLTKKESNLQDAKHQFGVVDDFKLRMTLASLANRYNEKIRQMIYKAYQDDHLASIYRRWRNSGAFEKGGKSKVHKEVVRFPNGYVYDFVDTVLSAIYDRNWLQNKRALKHELVRPWWIVEKL